MLRRLTRPLAREQPWRAGHSGESGGAAGAGGAAVGGMVAGAIGGATGGTVAGAIGDATGGMAGAAADGLLGFNTRMSCELRVRISGVRVATASCDRTSIARSGATERRMLAIVLS